MPEQTATSNTTDPADTPTHSPTPTPPTHTSHAAEPSQTPTDSSPTSSESNKLVPVSESIRYRKRAQQAEQELEQARQNLEKIERELTESRDMIDHLERQHRISELLTEADAIDLGVARLLTEATVQTMDEPDLKQAVADLQRQKPYLFRKQVSQARAMSAHDSDPMDQDVAHAAAQAAATGHRRDLLAYLRLKRRA